MKLQDMIIPTHWLDSNQVKLLKNKESCKRWFGSSLKIAYLEKVTFELDFIIKKQGLKYKFKPFAKCGWTCRVIHGMIILCLFHKNIF